MTGVSHSDPGEGHPVLLGRNVVDWLLTVRRIIVPPSSG